MDATEREPNAFRGASLRAENVMFGVLLVFVREYPGRYTKFYPSGSLFQTDDFSVCFCGPERFPYSLESDEKY